MMQSWTVPGAASAAASALSERKGATAPAAPRATAPRRTWRRERVMTWKNSPHNGLLRRFRPDWSAAMAQCAGPDGGYDAAMSDATTDSAQEKVVEMMRSDRFCMLTSIG